MVVKKRQNVASGNPWEPIRGYSRAVVVEDQIYISGTTAVDKKGEVFFPNESYEQTKFVLLKIKEILLAQGFEMSDVVRTRLYVTNINKWDDYAKAHREFFESVRPASSIVQVSRLIDPRLVVEIEVDAIRGCQKAEQLEL